METTRVHWVYIGIMEKKMATTRVHWVYIGITEKNMETTLVHWANIGIMEKNMETTIVYWVCNKIQSPCLAATTPSKDVLTLSRRLGRSYLFQKQGEATPGMYGAYLTQNCAAGVR